MSAVPESVLAWARKIADDGHAYPPDAEEVVAQWILSLPSPPDELGPLLANVPPGPWAFDEPPNWHGLAARIHPVGSGDQIATVDLKGWGRKQGLAICALIVALRNNVIAGKS